MKLRYGGKESNAKIHFQKQKFRYNIFEIYGERWNCSESKWIDLYCILFIVLQKCKKQSCSIGQQGSRADTSDNVLLFDAIFLTNGDLWGQVWILELKKSLNLGNLGNLGFEERIFFKCRKVCILEKVHVSRKFVW